MTSPRTSALLAALIGAVVGAIVAIAAGVTLLAVTGNLDGDEPANDGASIRPQAAQTAQTPQRAQRVSVGAIGSIYERSAPGVVFIQARGVEDSEESPFGSPEPRRRGGVATGSGFVMNDSGDIVTNAHVVQGADEVLIQFAEDGDPVPAKLVGADTNTDVALLKVDPEAVKLEALPLGNSDQVGVGEPTIAIGNPFGFAKTVTTGIVSGLEREIEAPNGFSIPEVIQHDAAINPGNSGGPLLDGRGRVIGVNSQIASRSGANSGVGFAVPINTVKRVIPDIRDDGEVKRAYLGISSGDLTPQLARRLGIKARDGAVIGEVVPGGPAAKAGLRAATVNTPRGREASGDLIVAVGERRIDRASDVGAAIADRKPGDEVELTIQRGDERRKVKVELAERPRRAPGG